MALFVCLAVLAAVAQANAFSIGCDDDVPTLRFSGCQPVAPAVVSAVVPSTSCGQPNLPPFDMSGSQGTATERVDRNTYQISLDNTGPTTVNCAPAVRSMKNAPAVQKPTITLPARIPGPKTLCNQCKCIKTIVKPQVYEQVITVPIVQRYIQTSHRPVVEKIHYQAVPANAQDNIECAGSVQSSSSCVAVETPRFTPVEVPSCETPVETPCFEQVSVPVQTVSCLPSCY